MQLKPNGKMLKIEEELESEKVLRQFRDCALGFGRFQL